MHPLIDTNVILRFLVENPLQIDSKFKGVYPFFKKLELGTIKVFLSELVIFQCFFVLTSYYKVPANSAAEKLEKIISFRGIIMENKAVLRSCFIRLQADPIDLVDCYILAYSKENKIKSVYSFDSDLKKRGLKQLKVG